MASGFRQAVSGSFQSDGNARTVSLGFPATRIKLFVDTGAEGEWLESMSAVSGTFKRITGGTGSFITTGGVSVSASAGSVNDQFTLGTDANLNPGSNHVVYWWAEE